MTLQQQILKGKCSSCLWYQGRCLARTVRSGNYYCKYYTHFDAYSSRPSFFVEIRHINGSHFVYLNDKKLPNPALRQSAPLHFLAYKLIELIGPFNSDKILIKITDPVAIKMLKAILDACKQQNKVKTIAGNMVLAFARYASRVRIGTLYTDSFLTKDVNSQCTSFL